MKRWIACAVWLNVCVGPLHAAEMRTWMSRKGGTMEAELGGVQGDSVTLINKDSKTLTLKIDDLSLADRQHLVEVGGAPETIITSGKPGLVEKEARIDTGSFKRREDKLVFLDGPTDGAELLETPHFLVATAGNIRPQAVAETAERLWHGMAFQHMNFRQDWADKRMLILLVEDEAFYADLGKWYSASLAKENQQDAAREITATWNKAAALSMHLPDDLCTKYNLMPNSKVFKVKEASNYRKPLAPFPTHSIAGDLLHKQMGGVSSYGSEGYFAITTGHAYFKEISLGGKSETSLITVSGSGGDDIGSKRGFEDGTSWARTLRQLVRSGKVQIGLAPMLSWKPEGLDAEKLVVIYSFAYYMQSDSKRLAAFAKMIRRIESSNQVPAPEEFAKIFGFDTVAAFEADWTNFIKEGDFK